MPVGKFCRFPASRRPHYEAFLYKERLIDFLKSTLVLTHCSSNGIGSHRTSLELGNYSLKYLIVNGIQSPLVYIQGIECVPGDRQVDGAVAHYLGEVAAATEQGIGNTGSSTAAKSNLLGSILVYLHL